LYEHTSSGWHNTSRVSPAAASIDHLEQYQSATPTVTSSTDRLANEVIGQCFFYGCAFVNSVLWINVAAGYAVASNAKCVIFTGTDTLLFVSGVVALPQEVTLLSTPFFASKQ
jgi:hypothetical protein